MTWHLISFILNFLLYMYFAHTLNLWYRSTFYKNPPSKHKYAWFGWDLHFKDEVLNSPLHKWWLIKYVIPIICVIYMVCMPILIVINFVLVYGRYYFNSNPLFSWFITIIGVIYWILTKGYKRL